jgi:hypothetical protein
MRPAILIGLERASKMARVLNCKFDDVDVNRGTVNIIIHAIAITKFKITNPIHATS